MKKICLTSLFVPLLLCSCLSPRPQYQNIMLKGKFSSILRTDAKKVEMVAQKVSSLQQRLNKDYPHQEIRLYLSPQAALQICPVIPMTPTSLKMPITDIPLLEAVQYFCKVYNLWYILDGHKILIITNLEKREYDNGLELPPK